MTGGSGTIIGFLLRHDLFICSPSGYPKGLQIKRSWPELHCALLNCPMEIIWQTSIILLTNTTCTTTALGTFNFSKPSTIQTHKHCLSDLFRSGSKPSRKSPLGRNAFDLSKCWPMGQASCYKLLLLITILSHSADCDWRIRIWLSMPLVVCVLDYAWIWFLEAAGSNCESVKPSQFYACSVPGV